MTIQKHWCKYRGNEKFAPQADGLYALYVETQRNSHSPYEAIKHSNLEFYREHTNVHRVVKIEKGKSYLWCEDDGHTSEFVPLNTVDYSLHDAAELVIGHSIYLWSGPHTVFRECFGCDKPIFPQSFGEDTEPQDKEGRLIFQTSGGIGLSDCGNYGSQTHDSLGTEWLHFVICDDCIIRKADKIVEYDGGQYENRANFRTKQESHDRHIAYLKEQIKLCEAANFEWREYTRDGTIAKTDEDVDPNGQGWFHKDWRPTTDPSLLRIYDDGSSSKEISFEIFQHRNQFTEDLEDKLQDVSRTIFHPEQTKEELEEIKLQRNMKSLNCTTKEEYYKLVKEISTDGSCDLPIK